MCKGDSYHCMYTNEITPSIEVELMLALVNFHSSNIIESKKKLCIEKSIRDFWL